MAYCHGGIYSGVINTLLVAGTTWKCSGMAVRISVTVVIWVENTLLVAGTTWKCSGMAVRISVSAVIWVENSNCMHCKLSTDRPFNLLKTKCIYVTEGLGNFPLCRWPSGAPDGHLQVWRYQMLYNTILTFWWQAQHCSKHVETYNKLTIKQEFVH